MPTDFHPFRSMSRRCSGSVKMCPEIGRPPFTGILPSVLYGKEDGHKRLQNKPEFHGPAYPVHQILKESHKISSIASPLLSVGFRFSPNRFSRIKRWFLHCLSPVPEPDSFVFCHGQRPSISTVSGPPQERPHHHEPPSNAMFLSVKSRATVRMMSAATRSSSPTSSVFPNTTRYRS